MDQTIGEPLDQVTGEPLDQMIGEPLDQIIGEHLDQMIGEPLAQTTGPGPHALAITETSEGSEFRVNLVLVNHYHLALLVVDYFSILHRNP